MSINDRTQITTSTDKNEILIQAKPNDEAGVVELLISRNDDGVFDKTIGETTIENNGSSQIEAYDALRIVQYATGKISAF